MHYKKPIYVTRKETFLASDEIKPYGDRISIPSESERDAVARKLLRACLPKKNKN